MRVLIAFAALVLTACDGSSRVASEILGSQSAADASEEVSLDAQLNKLWVTSDRLNRHTCPKASCGIVGQLMFREAATVWEESDGWARVSQIYDASCVNGKSEYVDSGNSECVADNGIVEGQFAEWVEMANLSAERPADPAETATAHEKLVAGSDDFQHHRTAFVTAATKLISERRCKAADFEEMGGWMKSVTAHKNEPVYFTYCGGMTSANRIYLNVETGAIF